MGNYTEGFIGQEEEEKDDVPRKGQMFGSGDQFRVINVEGREMRRISLRDTSLGRWRG